MNPFIATKFSSGNVQEVLHFLLVVYATLAFGTFLVWWLALGRPWQPSLLTAMTVLIITCPCALGLAVPAVQILTSGRLFRHGMLLKSANAVERLAVVDTIIFDKTGTLTAGKPQLTNPQDIGSRNMQLAVSLAAHSKHPLARALVDMYGGKIIPMEVAEISGQGLEAVIPVSSVQTAVSFRKISSSDSNAGRKEIGAESDLVSHGSTEIRIPDKIAFLQRHKSDFSGMTPPLENSTNNENSFLESKTLRLGRRDWCGDASAAADDNPELWLSIEGEKPLRFAFADALRVDAKAVIYELKQRGYAVSLLSGDREPAAAGIAAALGITDFHARVTPVEKHQMVEALRQQGKHVLMIGDGLNDAAALAAADVSMSPSSALDITQNAADIVFRGEKLAPVLEALTIAKRAHRLVKENFALSLGYNIIAVPLAMMGLVTPLIAAIAMSVSSLLVVANAQRLNRR